MLAIIMDDLRENIPSYDQLKRSFCDGTIFNASETDIKRAILGLSMGAESNEGIRHHYIVMSNAIQSIQLQRLLYELEKRNNRTQKWFVVIASATLIAAIVQICVAIHVTRSDIITPRPKDGQNTSLIEDNDPPIIKDVNNGEDTHSRG